ncbi:hypothetical protein [Chitinophaga sp. Cy-1792]|uniref:hypothetical protein n=1 Tax=Chitinophaga sp. Cy-1792 TaxID=2608339 RepID=UPI00142181A6|nr:hypothetical protein [Chitinophaga sp. Cy-1792]NIG54803.1 hypothetical protein [Chitinophaga sp. Cy-1792]
MYSALVFLHSYLRWMVVLSIAYAIFRAARGYFMHRSFTAADNTIRHWTATIAHIQLMAGMILYTQSPVVKYFWQNKSSAIADSSITFYSVIHIFLMIVAITILTIGSAMAKRKVTGRAKFSTILIWFSIAFIIIFLAVPWPFSPLSSRPLLR